jgi:HEXXH motif-containing protein
VSSNVAEQLRQAVRSRRLLLFRSFLDETEWDPLLYGPLPSPDAVWHLLERVQEAAPEALDAILRHPYTGSWLGFIHRLASRETRVDNPLWIHSGYFHSLAAVAAIRAGLDFEMRVPVRDKDVMLPTLGMARLESHAPWAEVCARDGQVEIRTATERVCLPRRYSDDSPGWWGIRQLVVETGVHRLAIRLDDLDPYRGLNGPVPPRRIDSDEVEAWRELFQQAWELIVRHLPGYANGMPHVLESIVPYPAVLFRNQSGSAGEAFGSAVMERPVDAASLAATLVHESQHLFLYGLTNLISLHADDDRQRFYTLWRDDPRPIGGVLHGIYSFFGVTEFWRAMVDSGSPAQSRRASFEFAYWRAGTWRTLQALQGDPALTEAGQRFIEGIAERLRPWQGEPVPDDIAELATSASLDHHAGWRIRHVRPRAEIIRKLVYRWLSGHDADLLKPAHEEPDPEPDGAWPGARTDLVWLHLAAPERGSYAEIAPLVPEASAADVAYVSGNFAEAVRDYQNELRNDPNRASSWVGLGLALSASENHVPAWSLLHHPELVRAVYREVLARTADVPEPVELAAWLSGLDR